MQARYRIQSITSIRLDIKRLQNKIQINFRFFAHYKNKVRVYGPGIEHGVLATFQSRFICDTRGAGAGQLTVRVRGPKGAFRVEMQRESQKDRTILCKVSKMNRNTKRNQIIINLFVYFSMIQQNRVTIVLK